MDPENSSVAYLDQYDPTMRERAQYRIADFLMSHGMDSYAANLRARNVVGDPNLDFSSPGAMGILDLTPLGSIFGLQEAGRTVRRGLNTDDAMTTGVGALEGILSLADTIPLVGGVLARAANPLVRRGTREAVGELGDAVADPVRRRLMQGAAATAVLPSAFGDDLADLASAVARRTSVPTGSGSRVFDRLMELREAQRRLSGLYENFPDSPDASGAYSIRTSYLDMDDLPPFTRENREDLISELQVRNPQTDPDEVADFVDEALYREEFLLDLNNAHNDAFRLQDDVESELGDLFEVENLTEEMLGDLEYDELAILEDLLRERVGSGIEEAGAEELIGSSARLLDAVSRARERLGGVVYDSAIPFLGRF
jgi:hypothetical protein